MTKKEAQALIALYNLQCLNHPFKCICQRTPKGCAIEHHGKTEDEFAAILQTALESE